jgi:hypothetical protein
MNYPFSKIRKVLVQPAAIVNNASLTVAALDCLNATYAVIEVVLGATDIALTAMKLQESDDNSTYTDVAGSVFGTSNKDTDVASTLPSATDDNKVFTWFVDLRGRMRYLKPVITIGNGAAGAFTVVIAELWRNGQCPRLGTDAGFAQRIVL